MKLSGISEQEIINALNFLDCEDQEEWIMAGMCIRHELGDAGRDIWLNWSSSARSYNSKQAKIRWKSFKGSGRTIGSLIYEAMNRGFKFNEKNGYISPKLLQEREQKKFERQKEEEQEKANFEARQKKQADKANQLWRTFKPCVEHPYLTAKDILPHSARVGAWTYKNEYDELVCEHNALIYPLSCNGVIVSLQAILPNGDKKNMWGAQKTGVSFVIGDPTDKVLICEGIATGITLHEATQLQVYCAIDAGNLEHVAKQVRKEKPLCNIVLCADNDQYKHKNTGIEKASKVACMVDADVVYPIFQNTENQPTDFNDLYFDRNGSFDEILEIVFKTSNYERKVNTSAPYIDVTKGRFVSEPFKKFEEESDYQVVAMAGLQTALLMSEQVPSFCTMDMIRQHLQHPRLNNKTHLEIMCRVQWAVYNRKQQAISSIRPKKWNKKHTHEVVHKLDHELIKSGLNIIFAPMGTGKTQRIIKPIAQRDTTFVAIAHRRSLIDELSNTLKVQNYETAKPNELTEKLAVCLPSAMSNKFKPFMDRVSNVAIDEISQNIRFTKSKECKASGVDQEGVFFGAKNILREACTAIVADASIDDVTMKFCEDARPDEGFNILEVAPFDTGRNCYLYDEENLLSQIQVELMNGGKVWCAIESVAKAEAMATLFSNYKVMLITSKNNTSKRVKEFLQDIKVESLKYDMVIASPVISSGVSVEHQEPHFTMIAGIAGGSAICFSDFAQMLGRVRYVKDYHVCLKKNNLKNEGVTANTILLGQRQASLIEGTSAKENDYSHAMATIEANERMYRADFANGFIWFLQYYCFNVQGAVSQQCDYSILEQLKEITKENKQDYHRKICEAEPITKDQAEVLDKKRSLTEQEQLELLSYKAKFMLGYQWDYLLTLEDIEMFEQLPKIDRFARLLGLVSKVDDSAKNISLRKFEKAQIKGIDILFEDIDLETTFFSHPVCHEIISRVCKNENRFLLSTLKLVPYQYARDIQDKKGNMKELKPPLNCSKAMSAILDKYGLEWKQKTFGRTSGGKADRGYMIKPESFAKMSKYAKQRYCM